MINNSYLQVTKFSNGLDRFSKFYKDAPLLSLNPVSPGLEVSHIPPSLNSPGSWFFIQAPSFLKTSFLCQDTYSSGSNDFFWHKDILSQLPGHSYSTTYCVWGWRGRVGSGDLFYHPTLPYSLRSGYKK